MKRMNAASPLAARIAGLALLTGWALVAPDIRAATGSEAYQVSCAQCHDAGVGRAPRVDVLKTMAPEAVLNAMEAGPMISMASRWSPAERRAIAEFVAGKAFTSDFTLGPKPGDFCPGAPNAFTMPASGALWNGWGNGAGANQANTRVQTTAAAGFTAADVPKLKVKWAFGFPGELSRMGAPTLAGGRLFVGSATGWVYSLDAQKGCIQWALDAGAAVRNAPLIEKIGDRYAVFFGDAKAFAWTVDAQTGKEIWKTKLDEFPVAGVTGGFVFYKDRIYAGVRSGEEQLGANPRYECCKFRGSLNALDAQTGKVIWKTYTIEQEPQPTAKNKSGTQLYGPSGAPIWSTPTLDAKLNRIYVTTGNNYSDPANRLSNAFIAFDADSGKILWSRQMTEKDAYNVACRMPDKTNCPDDDGPDYDFSSSPVLITMKDGRRSLVAGQKSAVVHAIDPDNEGEVRWQQKIGLGGTMGGVQWGSAVDQDHVYVALSDIGRIMLPYANNTDADPKRGGGMFALDLKTGKRVWYTPPPGCGNRTRCSPAQSQAVTAIPGVAFSGSVDGHLRGYAAKDGKIIWDVNTVMPFKTVNNVTARGGSLDGAGPVIGGGILYVNSGYSAAGGEPGNVLIAFSVDGK
jgi:polyvinyl alcohol dehydrogenase (cytochrome)